MPKRDVIEAALTTIFADVFERADIVLRPDLTAADVEGWDSFRHLEIVAACEQRFRVLFSSRELDGFRQVSDLVDAIARKAAPG